MKKLLIAFVAILASLVPSAALAADEDETGDVLMRIGANVVLAQDDVVGTMIVIDGDAVIDGQVSDALVVINGNALVRGEVSGSVTVISGDLRLAETAQVRDVTSINGEFIRAEGALVTGEINDEDSFGWFSAAAAVFSVIFWIGLTLALILAGVIFAAIGGRQLGGAAQRMTGDAVNTIIGVVFVAVALPIIALVAIATLIGLPFGIGLLVFLLPTLWFLGYIVAGARLGSLLVGQERAFAGGHPYAATVLGIVLLQLVALVPVAGALVAMLAGLWGAGALVFGAFRAAGGKGFDAGATAAPRTPQPAA